MAGGSSDTNIVDWRETLHRGRRAGRGSFSTEVRGGKLDSPVGGDVLRREQT
jgi:hypothetical protein